MLKFMLNDNLITMRAKKIIYLINKVSALYVKAKENHDGNLHTFEIIKIEFVLENLFRIRP
jgi:hypothetical protein